MEYAVTLLTTLIVGGIIYAIMSAITVSPGRQLQKKFIALGDMRGMYKNQIIMAVGHPQSVSTIDDTQMLLQWMATGYHISLLFENEVCQGVSHESVT